MKTPERHGERLELARGNLYDDVLNCGRTAY